LRGFNFNEEEKNGRKPPKLIISWFYQREPTIFCRRKITMEKKNDIRSVSERAKGFFEQGFN